MNAVLAQVVSFVMVFFIVLLLMGNLIGIVIALSHFVEWVVAPKTRIDAAVVGDAEEDAITD